MGKVGRRGPHKGRVQFRRVEAERRDALRDYERQRRIEAAQPRAECPDERPAERARSASRSTIAVLGVAHGLALATSLHRKR